MRKETRSNVRFMVNGKWIEKEVGPRLTLLRFLRDELGLTGTKDGCGKGQCGTCTVLIDGKAVRSCSQRVARLDGKDIETIEGLSRDGSLHPIQQAFLSTGAVQCGFCTPGMILATKALLEQHPSPSEEEIREGLKRNLCRCTGYVKILEAVKTASELMRGGQAPRSEPPSGASPSGFIGLSFPDIDGALKVKGELQFADDISIEGIGYGAIVWSSHPHAELLLVDTSEAKEMEGVRAVLTAKDVPGRKSYGPFKPDQPVLADKKVRFMGDPIALVVADSYEAAREAATRVSVEYRGLKGIFSPLEALDPSAPLIHDQGNILRKIRHAVGDAENAFSQADLVVEGNYSTPFVEHAYLECESAVATITDEGKVRVWTGTQMPFEFRTQIAACLGLDEEKVRISPTPLGGGFGGKVSITVQVLAALGAFQTGRPVKITLTREESLRFSPKKHASIVHYRTGFARDGRIVANQARILLDGGPYMTESPIVLDQAAIFSCGPYVVPNVDIEATCVYTNNAVGGAMRGLGINQVAFAMEQQLDIAARKLNIDPFDLRLVNALEPGKRTIAGETLRASIPMKETIRTAKMALASLGPIAEGKRVGIGVASAFKNVGIGKGNVDNASAVFEMTARGKVRICVSTVDMGQGSRTAMTQLAAHELGIGMDRFEIITGDTALQNRATGIVGERGTYCAGNAVIGAARKFKEVLLEEVATTYEMPAENLRLRENGVTAGDVRISFEEIGQRLASLGRKVKEEYNYNAPKTFPISADGIPQSGTAVARSAQSGTAQNETEQYRNYPAYCCTTNVALVEVNELTGEVKVLKVIVAVDVGRAINPQKIEGQIEGSVLMGMVYALSEQFEVSDGIPEKDLKKCGIPTIDQTPGIVTLIIEDEDPEGPYGAKGMSEVACAPVTPAIINAIYDAVGVRIFDLPATRDKILNALKGGV